MFDIKNLNKGTDEMTAMTNEYITVFVEATDAGVRVSLAAGALLAATAKVGNLLGKTSDESRDNVNRHLAQIFGK